MLYHFLGSVEVLQPPAGEWSAPGEGHEALPDTPNLYRLRDPPPCGFDSIDYELTGQLCAGADDEYDNGVSLEDAVWLFMNDPHPLTTLSDPKAYGARGSISRHHNPDNYARALGALLATHAA